MPSQAPGLSAMDTDRPAVQAKPVFPSARPTLPGSLLGPGTNFSPSLTGDNVVLLRTYLPALRHIFHRQKPARSCPAPQPDGDATVTPTGTPEEPCGVSSQSPAVLLSEPDDAGTQNGAWSRPRVGCFLHPEPCTWSGLPAPCVCEPRPPPRAFTITLRSEECEVSPSP